MRSLWFGLNRESMIKYLKKEPNLKAHNEAGHVGEHRKVWPDAHWGYLYYRLMPIFWLLNFYLTSSLLGLFVRVHVACICFRYTRHHIKTNCCIPRSVRVGALTRVELPPWLTIQVGGLSRIGRPSAVRDKTTLAVLWLRQRSHGDPAGTEGWGRVGFCLVTLPKTFQHHAFLCCGLKVQGGDGWCVNLGVITKNCE